MDKISLAYHEAYSAAFSYLIDIIEEWEKTGIYVNRAEETIKAIIGFKKAYE